MKSPGCNRAFSFLSLNHQLIATLLSLWFVAFRSRSRAYLDREFSRFTLETRPTVPLVVSGQSGRFQPCTDGTQPVRSAPNNSMQLQPKLRLGVTIVNLG